MHSKFHSTRLINIRNNAQCVTGVSHPENISKPSRPGSFAVFVCYTVFPATIGLKLYFSSGGDGFACLHVFLEFAWLCASVMSKALCLLTMYIWGSDWDRARWRFKHVPTQTWRQINKHACTHTKAPLKGSLALWHFTFHLNPSGIKALCLVRKRDREKNTHRIH